MVYKIVWSSLATNRFESITKYLNEKWSAKEALHFADRLDMVLEMIAGNPDIYRKYKGDVPEAVVTKHNLLIYRITDNEIQLVTLFDTRQHPRKKRKALR